MLVLLEIDGAEIGCFSETVRFSSSELRKFGHFNIMFFIGDKCSCNKNGGFFTE